MVQSDIRVSFHGMTRHIDVVMPRPDYEKFKRLVKKYPLAPNLVFDISYEGYVQKIIDKDTYLKARYASVDKHLWMDVFPIDGLPDNKKEAEDRLMKALNIRKLTVRIRCQNRRGNYKVQNQ